MANAAYDMETVYAPSGEPHECSRLNALDLVRTAGYTWRPSEATAIEIVEAAIEDTEAERAVEEAATEERAVNPNTTDLENLSAALAGVDAVSYLNGFSVEALRTIAEERYGERLRANISKEKAIERILSLEEARIAGESTAES